MKCPTCEHRVHPDQPKFQHDVELCARVAKLEERIKTMDAPSVRRTRETRP